MKIGFWGGCFNPPSNIHIGLANNLINDLIIDKLVFVPVNDYYQKPELESATHRYNMLKLATQNYNDLSVSDIEININKKLDAKDIFKVIHEKYINEEVLFIMGSDNFNKMPSWNEYNKIMNKYNFIVMERENYESENTGNSIFYTNTSKDISSSIVRKMIKNKEDVSELLDTKVYKYILENKLYCN